LIASGYTFSHSCILGVFLHGLAGDLVASEKTQEGMTALDLITFIPKAWKRIYTETEKLT
jgi:NAD(P)H-hydrate epimerase